MNKKFTKNSRLRNRTSSVIENGKRIRVNNIVLYYRMMEMPMLSVVAGRKVGNSVTRNRLKRWGREIFRLSKQKIKDYGVVIIFKQGSGDMTFEDFKSTIMTIWKKEGIIDD